MSKSIIELAREMSPMFEWRKRDDDSDYVVLKDGRPERFYEMESDVYTSDLTEWLHASNYHVDYLTQAAEEYGITDGFQLLSAAQSIQRREVAYAVLEALHSVAEELAA